MTELGEPAFRAKQVIDWTFAKRAISIEAMTNLPKGLRQTLTERYVTRTMTINTVTGSKDTTRKFLLKLHDGRFVETVLIPANPALYGEASDRHTLCVSSQVGCAYDCKFCASGLAGFARNLTAAEIVEQIVQVEAFSGERMDNLVFMGMGEPFLNWNNLLSALNIIHSKDGLNLGARKISISTAGIIPRINNFADLNTEINLAISLHSAVQSTRESLMPIAKKFPLPKLLTSLHYYTQKTRRQVFLEYAPIADINDTQKEIDALIKLLQSDKLFFLNLIPLNPVKNGLIPSAKLSLIEKQLTAAGVNYSLRHSLGQSINSACGQLATSS